MANKVSQRGWRIIPATKSSMALGAAHINLAKSGEAYDNCPASATMLDNHGGV
jgi:hypothetical protein